MEAKNASTAEHPSLCFMKFATVAMALIVSASFSEASVDEKNPIVALGLEAGSTGFGGSLWVTVSDQFVVNMAMGGADQSADYTTGGVDYTGSVDLANSLAVLEWHPSGGRFHLSAGMVLADNAVQVVGRPLEGTTYELDGVLYPATLVGSITGDVEWEESIAPYLGLGFSKRTRGQGWGAYFNAGVMYSGSAAAVLEATGLIAEEPEFLSHLRVEERELNEELDKFELYPVVRAGLMYRF
ncbi:outer membrane insertion C-terminal signal domain protein [Verrucomicrobiia bacterium DG1235]|nr:outer membrane insertion C-terminal signal domain protein [Verrucomicrobiae bacterium DG1235]